MDVTPEAPPRLWDTVFKDAYAYHWYDSNYAIVRQGDHRHPANRIIGLTQLVREFLPHELDHVAFGVWQERWFNEAMAQHVTLSFEDGRFEALSPEDRGRSRGNRVYVPERELLALVMYGGGEHIDASVATRAHTSSGPNSPEWQEFMARLDASWGTENFYNRLARSIAVTEEAYQAAYPQFSRAQIQTYAIQVVTSQLREELRAKSDQKKTKGSLMRVVGRLLRPNSSA